MTLNCYANNCIYNIYGICYAGKIKILGENASTTTGTTCDTFVEKKDNDNLSNNTSNSFTTSTDIVCNARNCNYNGNGTCTASSVQINFHNACCDTFRCF